MRFRDSAMFLTLALTVGMAGCSGRDFDSLEPAPANDDPLVFGDTFGDAVDFQAFLGSNTGALSIDATQSFQGSASLKFQIPNPGDPNGSWAGGAFTTAAARDFTKYNALTFYAKSSVATTLDVVGLANDNTGFSKYTAEWPSIPITVGWEKYIVPIPLSERLSDEKGLMFMAEGPEGATGHSLWFDEVRFEQVDGITDPRPSMSNRTVEAFVGAEVSLEGTKTVFNVNGTDQTILHHPGYFTFSSSNEDVVRIVGGEIDVVGGGSATITAKLGDIDAMGELVVQSAAPPSDPAPTPTLPADDVISLFSNAYPSVTVDNWSADWDVADVGDLMIGEDDVKSYTGLTFAGIEFTSETVDASEMTHFHMDVWVPSGNVFKIKLVDFGADGIFGGERDSEHELPFTINSTPPLEIGTWVSFDIPLDDFTRLTTRGHIAQLIIGGDMSTAFIDNIYFHK